MFREPVDGAGSAPAPSLDPNPAPDPARTHVPALVAPRARRRTALVAGAVLAVLAGAGGLTVTLLQGGFGDGGGNGIDSRNGSGNGTGNGTGNDGSTDTMPGRSVVSGRPSGAAGTSPAPTVTSTSASTPARTPAPKGYHAAPKGYHTVNDPMGFTLAVPDGFPRSHDDKRVFYMSADKAFRIGIRIQDPVPGGPEAAMRLSHADGDSTNPGYHDGSVTPTTHNGFPAALWEFTWNGFSRAEGERHTFDLCWEEGGRMYDVWVSAPVNGLDKARHQFDTALDSFVPSLTARHGSVR